MATLTVSTRVDAPVERTFRVFTALDEVAEHIPQITSLEVLTDGPFGQGTRWRETRVMFKKEATEEMWVTAFDPPRSYTVEAESHGMHYTTVYSFVADGDGTEVAWTFTGKPTTFATKLLAPLLGLVMKGTMRKCMQKDLEALRGACEPGDD